AMAHPLHAHAAGPEAAPGASLSTGATGATGPAGATGAPGSAGPAGDDEILAPPPTYHANDVTVDEHLGGRVPLSARFRTQDGALVTLGDVLRGDLPAILTFNYSDCPMLCSVQLNGLTAVLPKVGELAPSPDR